MARSYQDLLANAREQVPEVQVADLAARREAGDPPLVVTPISWFQFPWRVRFKRKLKFLARAVWHRTTDRRRSRSGY